MQALSKMKGLNKEALQKHIDIYASHAVVKRAKDVIPILEKFATDYCVFSYQGQEKKPYEITVFQKANKVHATCTCPFDWGKLCKHSVASIQYIINHSTEKKQPVKVLPQPKNIVENLTLENGLLTDLVLKEVDRNSAYVQVYSAQAINIGSLKPQRIITKLNAWNGSKQTFSFDDKNNQLAISCSCKIPRTETFCGHVGLALKIIQKKLGVFAFAKDYKEQTIAEYLAKKGLPANFDYKSIFEFSFDTDGFKVLQKVDSLVFDMAKAKKELLPQMDEFAKIKSYRNQKVAQGKTHGLGFCLMQEGYRDSYNFVPFWGKYKKNTEELSTHFRTINEDNLIELLPQLTAQEKELVLDALTIIKQNYSWHHHSGVAQTTQQKFEKILPSLRHFPVFVIDGHSFTRKYMEPAIFVEQGANVIFELSLKDDLYTLQPKLHLGVHQFTVQDQKVVLESCFCLLGKIVYTYHKGLDFDRLVPFLKKEKIHFLKANAETMFAEIIQPLSQHFKIETTVLETKKGPPKTKRKKQLYISDYQGELIVFKPVVVYDKELIHVHTQEQMYDYKKGKIHARDEEFENEFIELIRSLHPDFEQQDNQFFLHPEQLVEDLWLLETTDKLIDHNVEIFGAKDLKSFKYNLNQPATSLSVSSGMDWFDVAIEIKYGEQIASLRDVRKAILKKQNYVQLKDGTLGLMPSAWLDKFSKFFKSGMVSNNHIQVSNYQFNLLDELTQELTEKPDFILELLEKKRRLQNLETNVKVGAIRTLKATLRDYQKGGIKWLSFLHENKLGGCLADDMGLGKTIQVIALMALLKSKKKVTKPHLVVAPTSLIFNWNNEIEKFCPSLKVLTYTGVERAQLREKFKKYDIIITTYGSVLNDIVDLKEHAFSYVVLDESQAIKNPSSKRYKAVKLLKADHRLALTGTPIENNTFDLYAQMNFLNPGLLGSMEHFKDNFSKPIDKEQDKDSSVLLSDMLHPFMLRRTKEVVAKELPSKTESIMYCEMGDKQKKVYEAYKNKYRDYILEKMESEGESNSQFYVLEGLTKLRQICNSPALLNDEEDYGNKSVKLDMLLDQIKDKSSKHKILVFSQFTSMLALIKERLEGEKITYEYLDGKTRNRQDRVKNFQGNDDVRVFLISLKAGGVGLNLTKADYVFLVDPWWNPAVENQAIDRCYRIGQTQKVMAYRMICRETIEEKIMQIQQNKKSISKSIIQVDGAKKSFNKAQIKELFA